MGIPTKCLINAAGPPLRVIDRIGGMDVTLGAPGYDWFDYARDAAQASFIKHFNGSGRGYISERHRVGEERFIRRWGGLKPT